MALAEPGDPFVTGLGDKIITPVRDSDEAPDKITATVPVAKNYISKNLRMSLKEMPAEMQTQAIVNAVLVFHLMGLSNNEIALALNVSMQQISAIKEMTAYQETFELLFSEFIASNSQSLQSRIASFAARSVENIMELADAKAGDENVPAIVILKANQDVLDRSGLSADALFGKNTASDDMNLKIVIEDNDGVRDKVTVDFSKRR
jgi:hypothetical protein